MSLSDSADRSKYVKITLRTADQYHIWKARIAAACWSVAKRNIFAVTDTQCSEAVAGEEKTDWVGKSWLLITSSLHDELFMKVSHVEHGLIASLLGEIRESLLVNIAEDVQPLRLELYGATMANTGSDLQSFISFIVTRKDKLSFLDVEIPDEELIAVLLKGLHAVFQPLQVHFAIPGNIPDSFAKTIEIIRKFSASPIVHNELNKLKAVGLSQNIFASVSREKGERPYCIKFAKFGSCSWGDRCKFTHGDVPPLDKQLPTERVNPANSSSSRCSFCNFKGHSVDVCRKKAAHIKKGGTVALVASTLPSEPVEPTKPTPHDLTQEFTLAGLTLSVGSCYRGEARHV